MVISALMAADLIDGLTGTTRRNKHDIVFADGAVVGDSGLCVVYVVFASPATFQPAPGAAVIYLVFCQRFFRFCVVLSAILGFLSLVCCQ